jgi:predicted nucleotidyltransferase component of viral defense system
MIQNESFTKNWLDNLKSKFPKINPPLLEKMIKALGLVELLKSHSLEFVFKGGTSLLLHFQDPKRFSIDIDIITEEDSTKIEDVLNSIVSLKLPFIRAEKNERSGMHTIIPKTHYKLFYISAIDQKEQYILLDVLFTGSSYSSLIEVEIKTSWVKTSEPKILLKIPSIDSITGDKLTAFAPNTSGILYNRSKELEIIKQLFDIGNLFDSISNFQEVVTSYSAIIKEEISFRGNTFSQEDALDDTFTTCLLISTGEQVKDEKLKENYNELKNGLNQFKNYLVNIKFSLEECIEYAAKVALIIAKIKKKDFRPISESLVSEATLS